MVESRLPPPDLVPSLGLCPTPLSWPRKTPAQGSDAWGQSRTLPGCKGGLVHSPHHPTPIPWLFLAAGQGEQRSAAPTAPSHAWFLATAGGRRARRGRFLHLQGGRCCKTPGGGRWGTTDRCVMYTHMRSYRHAPVHTWLCMAPCESSHTSFCAWFLTQLRACGPCACRAGVNSRGAPPAWQGVGTAGGAQAMPPSANSCPNRPQFWHC